jgi:hypothetical protein
MPLAVALNAGTYAQPAGSLEVTDEDRVPWSRKYRSNRALLTVAPAGSVFTNAKENSLEVTVYGSM